MTAYCLWLQDHHETHSYQVARSCLSPSVSRGSRNRLAPSQAPPACESDHSALFQASAPSPNKAGHHDGVGYVIMSGMLHVSPRNKALQGSTGAVRAPPA